jgi:hypothetical protein
LIFSQSFNFDFTTNSVYTNRFFVI